MDGIGSHAEECGCDDAQVADAGAVPLLVLCAQEPELALKRVAASALSDMGKHTPELAQAVVDAGECPPTHPHTHTHPASYRFP